MAERSPADLTRNEVVLSKSLLPYLNVQFTNKQSVFLPELEYFQGIIFLTTNLYDSTHVAFRSRVNIHLKFDALSFSSRLLLWEKFLSRLPENEANATISDKEMKELAKWKLNGREIKNVLRTVRT
jgi:hypothetical protein